MGSLPAFVRDELEAFITCGDFERGFLVAQCARCGDSLRVPFACKSRGICPSCMGSRMAETAALLIEHRLPEVPWRQWVVSFEGPMAVRLGYDRALLGRVCQRFAKRVMQTLRARTKRAHELRSSGSLHPGVPIVVRRFRSDLGLYVHLHALVTDGCFEAPAMADDTAVFSPTTGLCEQDLLRTLQRLHGDLAEHLEGRGDAGEPVDEALVACVQLALPLRAAGPLPCESRPASPMLVRGFGLQLHAAVTVDGRDRKRLERVCRYLLRPPFSLKAVQRTADGQVRVHFKKPNRFGATYAQMSPHTFLPRRCALVPPPRAHTVLYYGVLSAHHALRSAVVPRADEPAPVPKMPALRDRPVDIDVLLDHFARAYASDVGHPILFAQDARIAARGAAWTGNVRELRNAVHRAAFVARGEPITAEDLFPCHARVDGSTLTIPSGDYPSMRRALLESIVRREGSQRKAAAVLKLRRSTLGNWLRESTG